MNKRTVVMCYNCGTEISKEAGTLTREHIPAQNLYAGYDDCYKNNRIVVPSCSTCNNGTNDIDEEFRNLIGTISENDQLNTISSKAARAIINRNKQFERLKFNSLGNIVGIQFKKDTINNNHKKIFKGLFYHQYGKPIPDNYKIVATFDPTDSTGSMVQYLTTNFEWRYSGHSDIFDYILQPFREGLANHDKSDLGPNEDENYYLGLLRYNKSHAAIVIATNQDIKPPTRN
ncbi:MAG: hypothetical protein MJA30_13105 [Cytophagales bacterium]|nr:hypothetical protein [Cytophagales bacterium]